MSSASSSFASIFPTAPKIVPAPTGFLPDSRTENGSPAFSTSLSANVDFYGQICRAGKTLTDDVRTKIDHLLPIMWAENPLLCLRNIVAKRDAREGAGEKAIFIYCYNWLFKHHAETAYKNLRHIPEYGYWKDLLQLLTTVDVGFDRATRRNAAIATLFAAQLKADRTILAARAAETAAKAIEAESNPETKHESREASSASLCAKWSPSLQGAHDKKFGIARLIAQEMGLAGPHRFWQRSYRQMLAAMRAQLRVVERDMCARLWEQIKLDHVPSVAMNRYKKCFKKHLPEAYEAWKVRIVKGEGKVNASQIMPHELVTDAQLRNDLTQLQWQALREHARSKGSLAGTIPISDVSGSMAGIPMDVSIALGILISELAEEPFKDLLITFSESPAFFKFQGSTLAEKVNHFKRSGASQGLNTDIIKCFTLLLQRCHDNKVPPEKMPKRILVLTDGQFDQQTRNSNLTAFQTIRIMYNELGYQPPVMCLWNLRGNITNMPVTKHETGAMVISGWSPNLLQAVLNGEDMPTPEAVMLKALNGERYARLSV